MFSDRDCIGRTYSGRFANLTQQDFEEYIKANCDNVELDTPIYRIFPYDRLMQVFREKRLCFVRPSKWDDPNENFYLRHPVTMKDGTTSSLERIEKDFFAQCWSTKAECDGLWRVYSDNKHSLSVQVKTSVRKIMNFFYDTGISAPHLFYFCGKVSYVSDETLIQYLEANVFEQFSTGNKITNFFVKTLLQKRNAFSYEEEIRFIFMRPDCNYSMKTAKNPWCYDSDLFFVNIEPNDCFEEIKINPWIDEVTAGTMKTAICNSGYTGHIFQSNLYKKLE